MEFRVRFYEREDGVKPVVEFLQAVELLNPALHRLVTAGLIKLRDRQNHGEPLTRRVSGALGIMELRVGRTDIARIFFFFRENREIVCTNGYVKKQQKLDQRELDRAVRFKDDWERRHP